MSEAQAFGEASLEAAQGYKPMPDPGAEDQKDTYDSVKDAAQDLTREREEQGDRDDGHPIIRKYEGDGLGEKGFGHGPDNDQETLTLERAARELSEIRKAEHNHDQQQDDAKFAADVDKLREGDAEPEPRKLLKNIAAERQAEYDKHFSDIRSNADVEKLAEEDPARFAQWNQAQQRLQAAQADVAMGAGEYSSEFIEAAMKLPQVQRAREQAQIMLQSAQQANEVAMHTARESFISQFPEVAALPMEDWVEALSHVKRHDPERFGRAVTALQRVVDTQSLHTRNTQDRVQAEQEDFKQFARAEDAKVTELLKSKSPEQQRSIERNILETAKDYGFSQEEFISLLTTNRTFRDHRAQRMMMDLAELRSIKSAKTEALKKPVPPVLRPGNGRSQADVRADSLAGLQKRFAASGSIKDAALLLTAERRAR